MGGFIDSVFGGGSGKAAKQSMQFQKDVYNQIQGYATPFITGGTGAFTNYTDMLFGPNQNAAFENWLNSSDYDFTTKAGMEAVTQNMASKGLLNSGSTLKALTQWGQQNAQQYRNNYMNQLLQAAGIGTNTLGTLAGAGNQAASNISQTAQAGAQGKASGVGNFLNFGLGIAGLFSDERLKTDIKRVGRMHKGKGGLPVYTYRYVDDPPNLRRMGVMAQEVAKKRPDALGPVVENFMTVDYGRLAHA